MRSLTTSAYRNGDLWAITCYFNPLDYRRKLANYRVFRERLSVPLVAVELGYGPEFELENNDAEILVQLRGTDILWQKERLLNLALDALPSGCRNVIWVDCDVVFGRDDWVERTNRLLDRFLLIQPFSHLLRMPRDWQPRAATAPDVSLRSVPFLLASGMPIPTCLSSFTKNIASAPGYAWAARRGLLAEHGLYDACIIGGGDSAFVRAAYGCLQQAMAFHHMNSRWRDHYLAWATPFYAAVRGSVAFLEGNLVHLWHGETEHRRYFERIEDFGRFQFDPFEDIAVDPDGAWRWNSDNPEMHNYVRAYLASRKEDG
jgi:hypothetical protein